MKSKLKCEVVKDLLPLYIDNLTSEVTNEEVKLHLGECMECKGVEDTMRKEIINDTKETVEREIDFLKKVKRKSNKKAVLIASISGIAILLIIGVLFVKNYIIGNEINYNYVTVNKIKVDEDKLNIVGDLRNEGMKVSDIRVEEKDGIVKVKVYEAKKINSKSEEGNRFEITENYKSSIEKIQFGDKVVYEDGIEIDRYILDIYDRKVQYVGDNSKVNQLEMAMDLGKQAYEIESEELLTSNEPYGIKYTIKVNQDYDEETIKEVLIKEGYMLLATIENLGEVIWEYDVEGDMYEFVVEEAQADGEMLKSIKEYGKSAKSLQELYNYLESN